MLKSNIPQECDGIFSILISTNTEKLKKKVRKSVSFADASEELLKFRSMTPIVSPSNRILNEKKFNSKFESDDISETNKEEFDIKEYLGNEHNFPLKNREIVNASTAKSTFIEDFSEICEKFENYRIVQAELEKDDRVKTCSKFGCGCEVF